MNKKEMILLMAAVTKGGKTTVARSLCKKELRVVMSRLSNCRTEVSVDWTYDVETENIRLTNVVLNYKGIFGTETKENFKCERFNEILSGEDGDYLRTTFGLEPQSGYEPEQLENYVEERIKLFINQSSDESLSKLIKDRRSNKFIRRIKVLVPPEESFAKYMEEKGITFVLRDTRGMLDMDAQEASKIKNFTMQEIGIDGIDAVLLMGNASPFPDILSIYKKAYQSAFESVPIFIMTREDSVASIYDIMYGIEEENVTLENVKEFLQLAKKGEGRGFKNFPAAFVPCYQLLEAFEMGEFEGKEFVYKYKVYDNEELRYVYPRTETLQELDSVTDYDAPDYKLYEMIVHENLKDMLTKMMEHDAFREAVFENGEINDDFIAKVTKDMQVEMRPIYQKYLREEVCRDILSSNSILGSRDGITTVSHNNIRYLGAVTSAASARVWLRSKVYEYTFDGSLKDKDGKELALHIPKEIQDNLIRMFLFKMIEENTDYIAYFQEYRLMNRYMVRDSIQAVRSRQSTEDALTETTREILIHVLGK